jgi:hypothetical protein
MSNSTTPGGGTQARQRTFRIVFFIDSVAYSVIPLKPDPEVASKAYRFVKRDSRGRITANYDVHVNSRGPECECKGYLRWRKPCKHIKTLAAAGMIPELQPAAPPSEPFPPAANAEPKGGSSNGQEEAA